ncbi:MAG: hypothetical protein ABIJ21_05605 [Nanoarchaeota archaeon]
MRRFMFVVVFLLCLRFSAGATIIGSVYDYNLEKVDSAIVTISTQPEQVDVTEDGKYEFSVSPGNYTLNATFGDESIEQKIDVTQDGTFRRDLILFPHVEEERVEDIDTSDISFPEEEHFLWPYFLIGFALLIILIILIIWLGRPEKDKVELEKGKSTDVDNRILRFIKEHKHTTQKEIRKNFPHSEAKISLILTDLEAQGRIRKVKKGRGNVIVYQK